MSCVSTLYSSHVIKLPTFAKMVSLFFEPFVFPFVEKVFTVGTIRTVTVCVTFSMSGASPTKNRGFNVIHQDNMSVYFIPPYTPLLYSNTGVYRGIHYFLNLL